MILLSGVDGHARPVLIIGLTPAELGSLAAGEHLAAPPGHYPALSDRGLGILVVPETTTPAEVLAALRERGKARP